MEVLPIGVLVDVVNGWGSEPRAAAEEDHLPFPERSTIAGRLHTSPEVGQSLTDAALRRLADQVYPVFLTSGNAQRAGLVTELLTRAGARPALVPTRDGVDEDWVVADPRRLMLGAAAVTLRRQLVDHSPARLGTCAGVRCADAFVDASPAGHRRFCSLTCQNRNRVAAFRRRAAAKSVAATGAEA